MKIHRYSETPRPRSISGGFRALQPDESQKATQEAAGRQDVVDVSTTQDLHDLAGRILSKPELVEDPDQEVLELKDQLDEGSYVPDLESLSDVLVDEMEVSEDP